MILIESNNDFYFESLKNLFFQKNFFITSDKSDKYFFKIFMNFKNNKLKITSFEKELVIKTPISFSIIFSKLNEFLINNFVSIRLFNYNPILQSLSVKNEVCYLGIIHNQIISNLILNLEQGINKIELYRLIWPNDKDIQINKLDTHITNLKNKISNDLSIKINFTSNAGNLILVTD